KAVGNDALHFNKDIISSPANNSVPSNVLNALYNMSDHLPVTLNLGITRSTASNAEIDVQQRILVSNPVESVLHWKAERGFSGVVTLSDLQGKEMYSIDQNESVSNWQMIPMTNLISGTYILSFRSEDGQVVRKKVVKL
ncbi:MAG: hypothetical protein RLZZ337_585, partial [Bacteroidota bacterium]